MARSRILLLACLMIVCKSDFPCSICAIRVKQRLTSDTILSCSYNGGNGIKSGYIPFPDITGWAVEFEVLLSCSQMT